MNKEEIIKALYSAKNGLVLTVIIIVAYMIIIYISKKKGQDKLVRKVANIIASLFVWEEAVMGALYTLLKINTLQYVLIIASVLVFLNNIYNEEQ